MFTTADDLRFLLLTNRVNNPSFVLIDLEQLVEYPTHIPDYSGEMPIIPYLFLTFNPFACTAELFFPLDFSDHSLLSIPVLLIHYDL